MEKNPQPSPEAQGPQLQEPAAGETDRAAKREQRTAETIELIDQIERGQLNRRDRQNAEDDLYGNLTGMHFAGDEEGLGRVHSALEDRMRLITDAGEDPRKIMPFGYGVWSETASVDRQEAFVAGREYSPRSAASTEAPKVAAATAASEGPTRRRPYASPNLEDTQPIPVVEEPAPATAARKHPYSTASTATAAPAPEANPDPDATGPIPRVKGSMPYESLRTKAAETAAATAAEAPEDGVSDEEEVAPPYQRRQPEDVKVWGQKDIDEAAKRRREQAPNVVESVDGLSAADITREAVRLSHLVEQYYKTDPEYVVSLVEEVEKKIEEETNEEKKIAWIAALQLMEETAEKVDRGNRGRHSMEGQSPAKVAERFMKGFDPRYEKDIIRDHVRAYFDSDPDYIAEIIKNIESRYRNETDPELKQEWAEVLSRAEAAVKEAKEVEKKAKAAAKTGETEDKDDDEPAEDVKISASMRAQFKILKGMEWLGHKVRRYRIGKIAVAAAGVGVAFYAVRQGWFSDHDILDNMQAPDILSTPHPSVTHGDVITNLPDPSDINHVAPERVVEEVPVPLPKAAINIEAGEGFAQTMRELGIKGDKLHDLLNNDELRQKLIDMNVAYVMDDGSIGIALDAGEKMPKAALNAIREAAGMDITHEIVKEVINPPVDITTPQPEITSVPTPQPEASVPVVEPGHVEAGLSDEDIRRLWLGGAAVTTLIGGAAFGYAYRRMARGQAGRHRRPESSEEEVAGSQENQEANEETAEFRVPLFDEERSEPKIAAEILRKHLTSGDTPSVQDVYDSYAELAGHMEPASAIRAMNQVLRANGLGIRFRRDITSGAVRMYSQGDVDIASAAERFRSGMRA